jgi:hypothetical protein
MYNLIITGAELEFVKSRCIDFLKMIYILAILLFTSCISTQTKMNDENIYHIDKTEHPVKIDGVWDKLPWKHVEAIGIDNFMGRIPDFKPVVKAKMLYDEENLYVIFHVQDRFVRCITDEINGPVWEDSCVEFFFSPDVEFPERYFNLEVNCAGTPLMHYNITPRKDIKKLDVEDIKRIEIAHSLPITYHEITEPVTWTIEYKIPLEILKKYSKITHPGPGIIWKANFYKIADKTSNPHYLTWNIVENDKPDFHLPKYFGNIIFK